MLSSFLCTLKIIGKVRKEVKGKRELARKRVWDVKKIMSLFPNHNRHQLNTMIILIKFSNLSITLFRRKTASKAVMIIIIFQSLQMKFKARKLMINSLKRILRMPTSKVSKKMMKITSTLSKLSLLSKRSTSLKISLSPLMTLTSNSHFMGCLTKETREEGKLK